jgi:predicted TIM-barrel fold metal-dependent hydrolase
MSEPLIIFSGDGHIGPIPEQVREYLEPKFQGAMADLEQECRDFDQISNPSIKKLTPEQLEAVDDDQAISSFGESGGYDMDIRLRELDREGVAGELLLAGHQLAVQPFFSVVNKPYPADLRAAGARAQHRWVADCIAQAPGRWYGVTEPGPCLDLDETIRELQWSAEHGFVAAYLPQNTYDETLPPLTDPYYEPYWAACADLGFTLIVHAGWGMPQGKFWEFAARFVSQTVGGDGLSQNNPAMMEAMEAAVGDDPLALDMGPRRAMWQLMLAGVFDRYPNLRLVPTEVRADWIPATLKVLEDRFEQGDTPLRKRPSEYWAENFFVTPSSPHRSEMEMRHDIGVERMIFGVDFPHPEGTWPNTHDWIRSAFAGVPEEEARAILGENAIRCFGLDRDKLAKVAERIAPKPEDVLGGGYEIDQRRLDHFNDRGGYAKPAEQIDPESVRTLFEEDLHAVASH